MDNKNSVRKMIHKSGRSFGLSTESRPCLLFRFNALKNFVRFVPRLEHDRSSSLRNFEIVISKPINSYFSLKKIFSCCLVVFLLSGCKNPHLKEPAKATALPEWIEALPYNTELSKTPGVSVIQVKTDPIEPRMISSDSAGWKSAQAEHAFLANVIMAWCDFEGIVTIDAELPEDRRYDISIDAPEGTNILELARTAFEAIFRLEYNEAVETHQVWVLQKTPEADERLEPAISENSSWATAQTSGGFGYKVESATMDDLVGILGKYLGDGLVFDETGIEGAYQFELAMDHWEPESALQALELLGLRAVRADREFPTLRIDYAGPQKKAE